MSDHSERLRRISDYSYHLERACTERNLARTAWCAAARAAHQTLAELHERAARERAGDWRPSLLPPCQPASEAMLTAAG